MKTDKHRWISKSYLRCVFRFKTFIFGICVIGLLFVACHSSLAQKTKTGSSPSNLFKHQPTVVTGRVGWSKGQPELQIEDFKIEIVKKGRVITGSPTHIKIRIAGKMLADDKQQLSRIKEIFVSERLLDERTPDKHVDVLVVPIVDIDSAKKHLKGGSEPFDVTIDYKLYGYQWDDNNYLFRCGGKEIKLWDVIPRGK